MPSSSLHHDFSVWLRRTARQLGGLDAACLRADSAVGWQDLDKRFERWLDEVGNRGALGYMDRSLQERRQPFAGVPWAKSVIVVTFAGDWSNLASAPDLPEPSPGMPAGLVSRYACGADYHRTGAALLESLVTALEDRVGRSFQTQPCVDTRPVPEVFLAAEAGLGSIGRSGLLRTPRRGSRVFIAVLFTELDLPEVRREALEMVACRKCGLCVKQCPTGALGQDGVIRVRDCRSYLSMEHRGALSRPQQKQLGPCLFGCDACTACCPPADTAPAIRVDLTWLLQASAGEVRRRMAGTALEHAGVTLLRRNAAAILANTPGPEAASLLTWLKQHTGSPVVLETVQYGLESDIRPIS